LNVSELKIKLKLVKNYLFFSGIPMPLRIFSRSLLKYFKFSEFTWTMFKVPFTFLCRLKAGWSSSKTSEPLRPEEQEAIISVIRRNEEIEVAERQRVGRLVERVEKIKQHAVERGPNCCRLCGDTFGILRPHRILCEDCRQSVCAKCSVDINIRYHTSERSREIWLCRICSETREMWKKSGAWFFKGLPKYDMPRSASATPIPTPGPGSMAGGWHFFRGVFKSVLNGSDR